MQPKLGVGASRASRRMNGGRTLSRAGVVQSRSGVALTSSAVRVHCTRCICCSREHLLQAAYLQLCDAHAACNSTPPPRAAVHAGNWAYAPRAPAAYLETGTPRARSSLGDSMVTRRCRSMGSSSNRWGSPSRMASSSCRAAVAGTPYHTCRSQAAGRACAWAPSKPGRALWQKPMTVDGVVQLLLRACPFPAAWD